jgi:hypothetical protein
VLSSGIVFWGNIEFVTAKYVVTSTYDYSPPLTI